MKVAIVAPLVSAIREPQRGGSQAFVSDLARGLVDRGHEVHLYAASGSEVPGVRGDRHGRRSARAGRDALPSFWPSRARGWPWPRRRSPRVYAAVREARYDVVHNHAFDAPAISLATRLRAPVVHTLHLPPDAAVADALRDAARSRASPDGRGRIRCARRALGAESSRSTRSCRRTSRRGSIRWSSSARGRRGLRRQAESGEGSARSDRDRAGRRRPDRCLRRRLRPEYTRERIDPRRSRSGRRGSSGRSANGDLGGDGSRGRRSVPRQVGGAVRDGRGRGAGVRDARRGLPPRRAR